MKKYFETKFTYCYPHFTLGIIARITHSNLSALYIRLVIAIDVIKLITEVSYQRDIINFISGRDYLPVDYGD